jgi:hypothetical protein
MAGPPPSRALVITAGALWAGWSLLAWIKGLPL